MGVILNWSSDFPSSIDDRTTNFPAVGDGVHDVLASHVNALADAMVAVENDLFGGVLRRDGSVTATGDLNLGGNSLVNGTIPEVQMPEQGSDPTSVSDTGFIYTKDVDGVTELFYVDDGGTATQITNDGAIDVALSLQGAYEGGNEIAVTDAQGPVTLTRADTEEVDVLSVTKTGSDSASAISIGVDSGQVAIDITAGPGDGYILLPDTGGSSGAGSIRFAGGAAIKSPFGSYLALEGPTGGSAQVRMDENWFDVQDVNAEYRGNNETLLRRDGGDGTQLYGQGTAALTALGDEVRLLFPVGLPEQGSDPSDAADKGFVYTKDVSGITELFYRDSDGNVVQITNGGNASGSVDSVFGRTGDVVAQASDYDASQIDDDSALGAASVAAALDAMLLLDGSRAMTGALDLAGQALHLASDGDERIVANGASIEAYAGDALALTLRELLDSDGDAGLLTSHTVNQSGTDHYDGHRVDVTESAVGDGSDDPDGLGNAIARWRADRGDGNGMLTRAILRPNGEFRTNDENGEGVLLQSAEEAADGTWNIIVAVGDTAPNNASVSLGEDKAVRITRAGSGGGAGLELWAGGNEVIQLRNPSSDGDTAMAGGGHLRVRQGGVTSDEEVTLASLDVDGQRPLTVPGSGTHAIQSLLDTDGDVAQQWSHTVSLSSGTWTGVDIDFDRTGDSGTPSYFFQVRHDVGSGLETLFQIFGDGKISVASEGSALSPAIQLAHGTGTGLYYDTNRLGIAIDQEAVALIKQTLDTDSDIAQHFTHTVDQSAGDQYIGVLHDFDRTGDSGDGSNTLFAVRVDTGAGMDSIISVEPDNMGDGDTALLIREQQASTQTTSRATLGSIDVDGQRPLTVPGESDGSHSSVRHGDVQTTDDTAQTVIAQSLDDDTVYWVEVQFVARDTNGEDRGAWVRRALVYREAGGAATREGSTDSPWSESTNGSFSVDIEVSGNDVIAEVTGAAGTTVNWEATMWLQGVS